ncbi:hypothetical protein [Enterobacter chuandaensis]|uniref:DUF551 domain-containing protein n=1 Tax=Enterobacter chuandaensis TaxID=2497875 RepID=A0AA96M8E7_9ENTR|nr:hypothetical protein [Enterobacter chuandaensis]WNS36203.1 hypothetical protein RQP59_13975 [Enterobacter chuandaensis]WNS39978.1 hypothetical protein RQP59_10650 [Enterobacter chuandaensis]
MSTITKEQAKDLRDAFQCWQQDYDPVEDKEQYDMFGLGMVAMDALLASLEAEAVAWRSLYYENHGLLTGSKNVLASWQKQGWKCEPLYTAPPATVSMKDHQIRDLVNELRDISVEYHGTQQLRERIARTIRAAMLQGAEPVTTANELPFEQWLSQQTGTIDVECGCVMTEVFFHWLRVAYEAGNSPVIPDGWVLVPEEPTHEMLEAGDEQFGTYDVYRRMIAASPQQEVK